MAPIYRGIKDKKNREFLTMFITYIVCKNVARKTCSIECRKMPKCLDLQWTSVYGRNKLVFSLRIAKLLSAKENPMHNVNRQSISRIDGFSWISKQHCFIFFSQEPKTTLIWFVHKLKIKTKSEKLSQCLKTRFMLALHNPLNHFIWIHNIQLS
jgi:hypothetical protein